jgi:hypothetical protein
MAKKTTTSRTLDSDVAKELEKALDIDLSGDAGDLDIAASMEDLEAQISQAADELAREGRNQNAEPVADQSQKAEPVANLGQKAEPFANQDQ